MLFWGLNSDISNALSTTGWGCPINIYKSAPVGNDAATTNNLLVFNKITVYFGLTANGFPSLTTAQYSFTINTGGNIIGTNAFVPLASINTNIPIAAGKKISCSIDTNAPTITCSNIGALNVATYWIAFSV